MRTEFGFLKDLKNHFNLSQIGDDCAVIPRNSEHDYVITSDLLVEEIDFRLDWISPKDLGYKALAVSISDVAAMAGKPAFAMISIGIPARLWETGFLDAFYKGFLDLANECEIELIGGDLSKTPEKVVIDSTLIGTVPIGKAVLRSGAKPGNGIFVTGALGGAAGGLMLLEKGIDATNGPSSWQKALVDRHSRPAARDGVKLRGIATSMIDISDGLSSDLIHLCNASGVGAQLFSENIPVQNELSNLFKHRAEKIELALNGGEDFELLFTADPQKVERLGAFPMHQIGQITSASGIVEIVSNGEPVRLEPGGFTHF